MKTSSRGDEASAEEDGPWTTTVMMVDEQRRLGRRCPSPCSRVCASSQESWKSRGNRVHARASRVVAEIYSRVRLDS